MRRTMMLSLCSWLIVAISVAITTETQAQTVICQGVRLTRRSVMKKLLMLVAVAFVAGGCASTPAGMGSDEKSQGSMTAPTGVPRVISTLAPTLNPQEEWRF